MSQTIWINGKKYICPNEVIEHSHKHHTPGKWTTMWFYKNKQRTKISPEEVKEDLVITSKNEYQIGIFYKMSAVSKADDCFDYYFRLKEGVAHNIIKVNKKYKSDTKNYNNKNRNRKKVECPKIDISQYERTKDGKFIVVFE
jgi:hypothetical protein|tara:strand:- start:197 stop:622 length:426 start_codon:yes stop_codon:yes gene_type:complete